MTKPAEVVAVAVLHDHVVRLTFADGITKEVDLSQYFHGPVFADIAQHYHEFLKAGIDEEAGTVSWPNGANIDPDVLYHGLTPAWQEDEAAKKSGGDVPLRHLDVPSPSPPSTTTS